MRNLMLIAAIALSLMGTLAVASDAVPTSYLGAKKGDTSASDTGSSDTGSSDTGDTEDTDDTDDTDDTSGDSGSSSVTCDSGDTGCEDDGVDGYSAAELAGEPGGFGCATLGGQASGLMVFGSVLLLMWRRDD